MNRKVVHISTQLAAQSPIETWEEQFYLLKESKLINIIFSCCCL